MTTLYFAYGSNLDFDQMRKRCPGARFVCRAVLKDHVLAFNSRSPARKCGVADVVPHAGHDVWGVVYRLSAKDLTALDGFEGFVPGRSAKRNAYNRKDDLRVLAENNLRQPLVVSVYLAVKQPDPPRPNAAYMKHIVDGAKFWNLPAEYIAELESIAVE